MWKTIFIGIVITVVGGSVLALVLWFAKERWNKRRKKSVYDDLTKDEIKDRLIGR